jgi:hypothetical protein
MPYLTDAEIEAGKTPAGGFTRKQLAKWGVSWPPPKGWRARLTGRQKSKPGKTPSKEKQRYIKGHRERKAHQGTFDANALLKVVVGTIISKGHASDLYDIPEILLYYGVEIPENYTPEVYTKTFD